MVRDFQRAPAVEMLVGLEVHFGRGIVKDFKKDLMKLFLRLFP